MDEEESTPKRQRIEETEEPEGEEDTLNALNYVLPKRVTRKDSSKKKDPNSNVQVLDPFSPEEARAKWPSRYLEDKKSNPACDGDEVHSAKSHFNRAEVDGIVYTLYDNAFVKAEDGKPNYIARILEIFEDENGECMFSAQWYFRPEDTVIQDAFKFTDEKRVFLSEIKDDNPLDCLVSKINVVHTDDCQSLKEEEKGTRDCDFFYDMKYSVPFFTFSSVKSGESVEYDSSSTVSSEQSSFKEKSEVYLLDLYSGCGAMSTGFCMGAVKSGLNLVSKWAVDMNKPACESLEKNHPEAKVWNMTADNFLSLIKEWEKLCRRFSLLDSSWNQSNSNEVKEEDWKEDVKREGDESENDDDAIDEDTFQVEKIVDICYGFPNVGDKAGLYLKVRWKGYDSDEDTWELVGGLEDCSEKVEEFVKNGFQSNMLPLPGTVDAVCGGPPCQGLSGFNRFRNAEAPLEDEKNKQLVVFMDIVEFLKPSYVLMENVVDIMKFSGGTCGRYAIGRLVSMQYQTRMGILAAGHYGVAQYRNRVFLWGCLPSKCLPQLPLPTHDARNRANVPDGFKGITVAYEMDDDVKLVEAVTLEDALRDLPAVKNGDLHDVKSYGTKAKTEYQKSIRVRRSEMIGVQGAEAVPVSAAVSQKLFDHVPLPLNSDDVERVKRIPKKKGANFRDFPGVLVDEKNTVYFDPSMEREMLTSGKPLVPDYAMTYVGGKSLRPFGRLWWDEVVPTVLTRAEPHNQIIIHPEQDRVLTVREFARLQGFPDCYRLYGPIKERYKQIGNAVAVPVAFALGYCLGVAFNKSTIDAPLIKLPFSFPSCLIRSSVPCDVEASD